MFGTHASEKFSSYQLSILNNSRATCSVPCQHYMHVKGYIVVSVYIISNIGFRGSNIFVKTPCDETAVLSVEDRTFLKLMGMMYTEKCHWTVALLFREIPDCMANNRA